MAADPAVEPAGDRRLRFTVEQYERMGEVGILDPDSRTELLDGEIVTMSPIGPKHASVVDAITEELYAVLLGRVAIRVQNPVRLLPRSEPQPDIVVARRRQDRYRGAHPAAEDTLLVIEVAESSLRLDRLVKVPIYAHQRIPEVWIVDIAGGVVHVHAEPVDGEYRQVHTARGDDELTSRTLPELRLTPADLLGD